VRETICDFRFWIFDCQQNQPSKSKSLRLGVPRVMQLDALRQEAFAAALAATGESGASTLAFHAGAKSVLTFARALGRLVSAFHKTEKQFRRD
jgi:hypothetical protein